MVLRASFVFSLFALKGFYPIHKHYTPLQRYIHLNTISRHTHTHTNTPSHPVTLTHMLQSYQRKTWINYKQSYRFALSVFFAEIDLCFSYTHLFIYSLLVSKMIELWKILYLLYILYQKESPLILNCPNMRHYLDWKRRCDW